MVQDKGKLVHSHPANELTEKLFGIESVINKTKTAETTTTTLALDSDAVPTDKIWKITHITAWNQDGDIATMLYLILFHDDVETRIHVKVTSTAQYETVDKHVELYLDAGDYIQVYFAGVASGETCYLNIFGYEMNAP